MKKHTLISFFKNPLLFIKFKKQFERFKKTNNQRFFISKKNLYPCFNDINKNTSFDKHYIYHTAWAARKLKENSPVLHIDISSYTYFSTLVSAFIPVNFFDYRPAKIKLDNFSSKYADITKLPFNNNSIKSLSCMHVVEHIGLGRYGEPLDVDGDLKAISELKRVIAKNGNLLFVVPIGKSKIFFNAHRVYAYEQICSYFKEFKLIEFTLIPDQSDDAFIVNATKEESNRQSYACGCFLFKKT